MLPDNPFGEIDGARAPVSELIDDFIPFDVSPSSGDLGVRILAGRKGSGKTIVLRRLLVSVSENNSIYIDQLQQDTPSTEDIIRYARLHDGGNPDEAWKLLWNRAFLRSVVSHLTWATIGSAPLCAEARGVFEQYDGKFISKVKAPCSVYSQLAALIHAFPTKRIVEHLQDPRWQEIEHHLARLLQHSRPMYFFVDSADENFSHAPRFWLECQKGLFLQLLSFLRGVSFGGRLHIFAALRDLVLASMQHSEHSTRYVADARVASLVWGYNSIRDFLNRKLAALPKQYLIAPNDADPLVRWLGRRTITNVRRRVEEDLYDYLIRHTRLIPRDIVSLGNQLCSVVAIARKARAPVVGEAAIRECVSAAAKRFGNEQLLICTNEIACDAMPKEAALKSSQFYLDNQAYLDFVEQAIRTVIKSIGVDRFKAARLQTAIDESVDIVGVDVMNVLWKNGLLGFRDRGVDGVRETFFDSTGALADELPRDKREYVFHPCVIDAVGIRGSGKRPPHINHH